MKKSKIYTKTGDSGETGLVSGSRVSKADLRIDLYGEVDELNSRIGFLTSQISARSADIVFLREVQSVLFDLGSNLACEYESRKKFNLPQIKDSLIEDMENEIDRLDQELLPLKNFILPGGSSAAAAAHLCRTCARSVERKLVNFKREKAEFVPDLSLQFLNRLSDYFFVLARHLNLEQKIDEPIWRATE